MCLLLKKTPMEIASYIDHTLLKATATQADIISLCEEAKQFFFASVCIQPYWVPLAQQQLCQTNVKVCTVIGFPLGANTTAIKIAETKQAIADGANEIDMVVNIGAIKSQQWHIVKAEIEQIVTAASPNIVKVILETSYLSTEEKIQIAEIAIQAGAHFIKTSTGFGGGGATIEDIMMMKKIAGTKGVKASGGIKTTTDAMAMINAGATRIGTSNGVAIMNGSNFSDAY